MGIVVSHQPAVAAPGLMAARTGQLEYRNQRRRELEALAMQQAEMAQRARMQRESIAAGFQRQNMAHMQNMQNNAWQQHWQQGRDARLHQNQVALNQQDFVERQQILDQGFQNNKQLKEFDNQLRIDAGDHRAQQDQLIQSQHDFHQARLKNLSPQAQALYKEELNNFHSTKMEVPEQEHGQLQEQSNKILEDIYTNPANQVDKSNDPGYRTPNGFEDGIDLINGDNPGQKIPIFNGTIKNPEYNPQAPPDPIANPERIEVSIPDYEEQSKKPILDASGHQIGHTQIKVDPLTGKAETIRVVGEEGGYLTEAQRQENRKVYQDSMQTYLENLEKIMQLPLDKFERKKLKDALHKPVLEESEDFQAQKARNNITNEEEQQLLTPAEREDAAIREQEEAQRLDRVEAEERRLGLDKPPNINDLLPTLTPENEDEILNNAQEGDMVNITDEDGNELVMKKTSPENQKKNQQVVLMKSSDIDRQVQEEINRKYPIPEPYKPGGGY
jgi:ribosomal protein S11